MLRRIRYWLTARAVDTAVVSAPHLSVAGIDRLTRTLAALGRGMPVVPRNVRANMQSLGVYSPAAHRAYFENLGRHFAGGLLMLRYADAASPEAMAPDLARVADERVELDASIALIRDAATHGGVIIVGPHIANYLMFLARLNQDVRLTVYLRHAKDARGTRLKQRWFRAAAVEWIAEAATASGPLGRLGRMADVVRAGRTLYVTPDLPQKAANGVAVRFFDREIYLPSGPALLSVRTGAPLYFLSARTTPSGLRLCAEGPYVPRDDSRGRDARRAAVQDALQWFTSHFEQFLETEPALWYLWGDKRWTRLLGGDPRYARRLVKAVESPRPDVLRAT